MENTKTFEELSKEATSDLQAVGFSASAGSIAKLFMKTLSIPEIQIGCKRLLPIAKKIIRQNITDCF